MIVMCRRLFIALAFFAMLPLCAYERIISFDSDITIHEDSRITVKEIITVQSEVESIRHGIVREFPTSYRDAMGNAYTVDFHIKTVLLNGRDFVPYSVENASNGKKLYIGDSHRVLFPGIYTYTIVYETNRHIGFFKDHDELYFNITGNGWRLPIDRVFARIIVPVGVPIDQIQVDGYTGYKGSKGKSYTVDSARNGVVRFTTTRRLNVSEGLTVVVGWPKGFVQKPSWLQEWRWFFRDNMHVLVYLIGLFLLLFLFYRVHGANKKRRGNAPVIPLFYPPNTMSPGQVRYVDTMKYDNIVFAADVVNMAVHGYLSLDYKKGTIWGGTYTLHKKEEPSSEFPLYEWLWHTFFFKKESFKIDKDSVINACVQHIEQCYAATSQSFFQSNVNAIVLASMISFLMSAFVFLLGESDMWGVIAAITYIAIVLIGYALTRSYTVEGFDVKRKIEGFKLFLSTTETDRLKIIGTPPTQTPELYEKYLPYAIALGVEEAWTSQFAPIFKKLEATGHPYHPVWIVGGHYNRLYAHSFASNVSRSVSSAISSASSRPGSSSGFGGRGSSGGGGGGGGGGGW